MSTDSDNTKELYATAEVYQLSICHKKGAPREMLERLVALEGFGAQGDRFAGKGARQISFLSGEVLERMRKSEYTGLCVERFMGNIITRGLDYTLLKVGDLLVINDCLIRITQLGKDCYEECTAFTSGSDCPLVTACAFGAIMQSGEIARGDKIILEHN